MAKILLFGQAKFGASVLQRLLEAGHEVTAASMPPDKEGRPLDPLKSAALEAGVRTVQRKSYKPPEAFDELAPDQADLGVLAFVTQIIPLSIVDAPAQASICFHPSLLPAYRGGSAIAWQLIKGETRGGVTLFRPDEGIDTGPIYVRREIRIGPDESAGSYYYGSVFDIAVDATMEAVDAALGGRVPVPQEEAGASYDPLCTDEHASVDWAAPAETVHNLVRGCDPSPGAYTVHGNHTLRLYGSKRPSGAATAEPGTVVSVSDRGLEVAAGDGTVAFAKLAARSQSGEKTAKGPAAEVAQSLSISEGVRLGV